MFIEPNFDIFSSVSDQNSISPLAIRMRPENITQFIGQEHLLAPHMPIRRLIDGEKKAPGSIILWGPPGVGKTTLAYLVAKSAHRNFIELSAVSAGVKEIRTIITQAKHNIITGKETVIFIDEVHRFSRTQQDALLPAIENRWVVLIAATTENPAFSIVSPLLSRSLVLTLKPITTSHLTEVIKRALAEKRGYNNEFELSDTALTHIIKLAGHDARKALTILEAAAGIKQPGECITITDVENTIDVAFARYDRNGDQHYDITSAFIKSMRGSDVNAAIYYLARMLVGGEDIRFIARRIMICAAEDVGMADPTVLRTAVAVSQAVEKIGMPEARILLAQAVVAVSLAPKSNRVYQAIDAAMADVKAGELGTIPMHLRDAHYSAAKSYGHGTGYLYAHDHPQGVAKQRYIPLELGEKNYYEPTNYGFEAQLTQRMQKINSLLGK